MITEAAVGSTLCKFLLAENRTTYCLLLFIASYLCAGIGMLLAAAIIVLYLQRLILHHLPPREVVVSSWLPVGPIGQGGFALIELGHVAVMLFPRIDGNKEMLQMLGPAMLGSAVLLGLLLWGCAHLPLLPVLKSPTKAAVVPQARYLVRLSRYRVDRFSIPPVDAGNEHSHLQHGVRRASVRLLCSIATNVVSMYRSWWAFTCASCLSRQACSASLAHSLAPPFPRYHSPPWLPHAPHLLPRHRLRLDVLQVRAALAPSRRSLPVDLDRVRSRRVCATIFTFSVFSLWCVVFVPTAIGFFRGTLFPAPCLQTLPQEYVEKLAPAAGGRALRKEEARADHNAR